MPRHCIWPSGHDTADPSLLLASSPTTGKTSYECGDLQVKCCRFVSCLCPSIVNNPNVYWLRRKPVIDGSVHQVMGQNSLQRSSLHWFSPLMHPLFQVITCRSFFQVLFTGLKKRKCVPGVAQNGESVLRNRHVLAKSLNVSRRHCRIVMKL